MNIVFANFYNEIHILPLLLQVLYLPTSICSFLCCQGLPLLKILNQS